MIDTIFALSSGHGKAGVAVIRISGPEADAALLSLAGRLPEPRRATLMKLRHPRTGDLLDQALVLRFPIGQSFTGELCIELQVHGGRAVLRSVLDTLRAVPGLRPAFAGEFTRRALENGRIDLTQAEALADLIDADTELQQRQALRGAEGIFGAKVRSWRNQIVEAKALLAAEIDFSDEGDVGDNAASGVDSVLQRLEAEMTQALASARRGRIVNEGCKVVIAGAPNAGKSTLMNVLAGSDVAIVTEHAGTTRDVIEVHLDLKGMPVRLLDTAGLRLASDPVEQIGVARAEAALIAADIILALDGGDDISAALWADNRSIRVRSKIDLHLKRAAESYDVEISASSGAGLSALKELLTDRVEALLGSTEPALVTRLRHQKALEDAVAYCQAARKSLAHGIEFADDHVRRMDNALSGILGLVGVEEVLGAIFSRFCVGK
jgi:tRNA modification GTPase